MTVVLVTALAAHLPPSQHLKAIVMLPSWITNPSYVVTWVSFFGAIGALGWKCWEFKVARRDRSTDKLLAVEAFWYQSIVVPQVLEPLLKFVTRNTQKYLAIDINSFGQRDPYRAYQDRYQIEYSLLGAHLRILQVISPKTYELLMARLDDLEDKISLICFRKSQHICESNNGGREVIGDPAAEFANAQNDCVLMLKKLHTQLCCS